MIDKNKIIIRNATIDDIVHIQKIYAHHVKNGLGTFEEIEPSIDEMKERFIKVTANNYPYLVAQIDNKIIGYAYGGFFRERSAYRFTVEDSIYIADNYRGSGVGSALLGRLIQECKQRGFVQMFAVIGGSDNSSSINLHKKSGFGLCGVMHKAGYKFDKWVDVVIMELTLN